MKFTILLVLAAALAACSPENACHKYGFVKGTTAFAQCVQNEVLTQRKIMANINRDD